MCSMARLSSALCVTVLCVWRSSDGASVAALAATLFEQMREHCLKNVVLKYQCFFVNRCANELATGALVCASTADG